MVSDVIIIGGNHHNMLGVIRELGKNSVYSNIIVTNSTKYAYVTKSKYVANYDVVPEREQSILKILKEKYTLSSHKMIIIPTSDFAEYVIDKNLKKLSKNFILPNINKTQGKIVKYMNKFIQHTIFERNNIKSAISYNINILSNDCNKNFTDFPYIIKPLKSINGQKTDIEIVNNSDELFRTINCFKAKKYDNVLIQKIINYDFEYTLMGISYDGKVYCPGGVKKLRTYPLKKGNVSYGIVTSLKKIPYDLSSIFKLLSKMNYNGLFDIEIFGIENDFYINEINFRNSGNSYAYHFAGIDLAYIYYLLASSENKKIGKISFDNEYYMIDEFLENKQLKSGNIKLASFIKSRLISKSWFVKKDFADFRVVFWKDIYAILRRIDFNGKI